MIAAESGYDDVAKFFIESGANVNARSVYGTTPLSSACKYRYHTIVKHLLRVGADTSSVDLVSKVQDLALIKILYGSRSRMVPDLCLYFNHLHC